MGQPTSDDPLGQRPDFANFSEMLELHIDARIAQRLRGITGFQFNNTPDMALVNELLARGWAVFKPNSNKD